NPYKFESASAILEPEDVDGAFALFSHQGGGTKFEYIAVQGTKIKATKDNSFGPLLAPFYTISKGVLKMTVQSVPLNTEKRHTAHLYLMKDGRWDRVQSSAMDRDSLTFRFRQKGWDS